MVMIEITGSLVDAVRDSAGDCPVSNERIRRTSAGIAAAATFDR